MESTNKKKKMLEVVLKIAGRCNINCKYCYMYNLGNNDYIDQPSYMGFETLNSVIQFLEQGIIDLGLTHVVIIFHGGEPMMMKAEKFDKFCTILRERLKPKLDVLSFSMQTNATLISSNWIKILSKNKISLGVSLDGPEKYHDEVRLDHQGRGTYKKAETGLRTIQSAATHDLVNEPGVLCVVNKKNNGREVYRHFVDNLNITWMSFLLPLETHDTFDSSDVGIVTEYLLSILNEWLSDDNPSIVVRQFDNFLKFLTFGKNRVESKNENIGLESIIVPIATNGDISADDEAKPINFGQELLNVKNTTLVQHINSESYKYLNLVMQIVPEECSSCEWVGYCRGGAQNQLAINRFSKNNLFNNKSIFCETYKKIYSLLAKYMLDKGLSEEDLVDILYESTKELRFGSLPKLSIENNKKFFMKLAS